MSVLQKVNKNCHEQQFNRLDIAVRFSI